MFGRVQKNNWTVKWYFREFCAEVKTDTAQKMFSIKDFFSKCDQIRCFLRIWSHLLKKSLMENFIFCAVGWKWYFKTTLNDWYSICNSSNCYHHRIVEILSLIMSLLRLATYSLQNVVFLWNEHLSIELQIKKVAAKLTPNIPAQNACLTCNIPRSFTFLDNTSVNDVYWFRNHYWNPGLGRKGPIK